jgi:hypothetical protein
MGLVFDRRSGGVLGRRVLVLALFLIALSAAGPAGAFYFDDDRNFSFRLRAYAQGSMATQGAEVATDPGKGVGQIVSQRNFMNPELDGKLNPYLNNWGFHYLDDLSFRVAGWMFYDGYLDYGPVQYANRAAQQQFHVQSDGTPWPHGAYQTQGYSLAQLAYGGGSQRSARDIYGRSSIKYIYPRGMPRGSFLFNEAALYVETDEPVIPMEGVFDAMPYYPHATAFMGKPSDQHYDLLCQSQRPIAVAMDGDATIEGWSLTMKLRLDGLRAGHVALPAGRDPNSVDRAALVHTARRCITEAL